MIREIATCVEMVEGVVYDILTSFHIGNVTCDSVELTNGSKESTEVIGPDIPGYMFEVVCGSREPIINSSRFSNYLTDVYDPVLDLQCLIEIFLLAGGLIHLS